MCAEYLADYGEYRTVLSILVVCRTNANSLLSLVCHLIALAYGLGLGRYMFGCRIAEFGWSSKLVN